MAQPLIPIEGESVYETWDVDFTSDTNKQGQKASKDEVPESISKTTSSSSSSSSSINSNSALTSQMSTPLL